MQIIQFFKSQGATLQPCMDIYNAIGHLFLDMWQCGWQSMPFSTDT